MRGIEPLSETVSTKVSTSVVSVWIYPIFDESADRLSSPELFWSNHLTHSFVSRFCPLNLPRTRSSLYVHSHEKIGERTIASGCYSFKRVCNYLLVSRFLMRPTRILSSLLWCPRPRRDQYIPVLKTLPFATRNSKTYLLLCSHPKMLVFNRQSENLGGHGLIISL